MTDKPNRPTVGRKIHASLVRLNGGVVAFYADKRGVWREPLGTLRHFEPQDRDRLHKINVAGWVTAEMLRGAP